MSEFKRMRTEGYFVPRDGGPPTIIRDMTIGSFVETTEFLDRAGNVVRVERNGVRVEPEDGK